MFALTVPAENSNRPHGVVHRQHPLHRNPGHVRIDGAQHLVPGHDVQEGRAQRVGVDIAGQPQHHRDVVGGSALESVEEPQAALSEGQRQQFGPGLRRERRPIDGVRRVRGEQSGHGRRVEQRGDRQAQSEDTSDAAE